MYLEVHLKCWNSPQLNIGGSRFKRARAVPMEPVAGSTLGAIHTWWRPIGGRECWYGLPTDVEVRRHVERDLPFTEEV